MTPVHRGSSAHADGGAAKVKKRFSLAARHRFFGQAPKKWGRKAGQANDPLPTYRRTRRSVKKRGNPRRGFPLRPPSCAQISTRGFRPPRRAEPPCAYLSAGGGSKGEPSPGVPPFLYASTCAPIRWEGVVGLPCLSTPFLWCLPKETVSSRQRKALFYLGGSTIRVSAAASVDGGHLRPTWGRGLVRVSGRCGGFAGGRLCRCHGRFLLSPNTLYSRSKRQAKGEEPFACLIIRAHMNISGSLRSEQAFFRPALAAASITGLRLRA